MERRILAAALQQRAGWSKIAHLLEDHDLSEIGNELWKRIDRYYIQDEEAQSVDIELLKSILVEELPKQSDLLVNLLDSLKDTSVPNVLAELTKIKKKAVANEIIQALAYDAENPAALGLMDKYFDINIEEQEEVHSVSEDAKAILTELSDRSNLIRIYPNVINDAIDGGVIGGNHILVFARSNCGKTMFNINLGAKMARDGHRVLHLINEEPRKQLLQRYINRMSGLVKHEVYKNIDYAIDLANDQGLSNVFIEDINPGTFHEIRGLIERIEPDVVIIDQIRNIRTKAEGKVQQLEEAATEARNLAKKYNIVVVSVTQAGDSATNKLVLSDSDIDNSKTGIPGQCDLIIGLGVDDSQRRGSMRTITIVKNKITNVHEFYPVRVDENLSKIVSM